MTRKQIGDRIKARLDYLKRSQTWLAQEFGVQPNTMSQYLGGTRGLEAVELKRLAEILDVRVAYFYGEEEDAPTTTYLLSSENKTLRITGPAEKLATARDIENLDRKIDGLRELFERYVMPGPPWAEEPEADDHVLEAQADPLPLPTPWQQAQAQLDEIAADPKKVLKAIARKKKGTMDSTGQIDSHSSTT